MNVIAALNPSFGVVVSVKVFDPPAVTLIVLADDASKNEGAGATVTDSAAVCFVAPLLAATVTG